MTFDKLKQKATPLMPAMAHNPGQATAPLKARTPGLAEQVAGGAVKSGVNSLATSGAEALFGKLAGGAAATAAPTAAAATTAATGAATSGATGALGAAAMSNPVTAPLAIGAALLGGKKALGK